MSNCMLPFERIVFRKVFAGSLFLLSSLLRCESRTDSKRRSWRRELPGPGEAATKRSCEVSISFIPETCDEHAGRIVFASQWGFPRIFLYDDKSVCLLWLVACGAACCLFLSWQSSLDLPHTFCHRKPSHPTRCVHLQNLVVPGDVHNHYFS